MPVVLDKAKEFDRSMFNESFSYIGSGKPGGKASGLALIKDTLDARFEHNSFHDIIVDIPRSIVILTDIFDAFIENNHLRDIALSEESDERIAHEFQKAELPTHIVGDLMSLMTQTHQPLAIRSSSLLEDSLNEPFAGVYATKMTPNNHVDKETRFKKLSEAIKFVYASTFFTNAKDYCKAIRRDIAQEKMAVIIQEVVGYQFVQRFYPTISGVARSYNFYPTGNAKPEDSVVNLALGLGKTIVDGGKVWWYSPAFPHAPQPYNSIDDLLELTQTEFWAVNMGKPPEYDPTKETEYLIQCPLQDAENDETLQYVCSTYDALSEKLKMGISASGPRVVNFSPVLVGENLPLNELLKLLLSVSEERLEAKVEIEFAIAIDPFKKQPTKFGFLQVRPLAIATQFVDVNIEVLKRETIIVYSERVMGNGELHTIEDIVYVHPEKFEANATPRIAKQIERMNAKFLDKHKPYVLIGFGRWGSADPWLGIPVQWSQISSAKVIVEATLSHMNPDLSQGSHFFHNITNLGIVYFSVGNVGSDMLDWKWLLAQPAVEETEYVRHSHLKTPLTIMADGRKGVGVIFK